jgi:hypothetical protein
VPIGLLTFAYSVVGWIRDSRRDSPYHAHGH